MSSSPGKEEIEKLKFAGFNDPEIAEYQSKTSAKLSNGGFSPKEIKEYFGETEPDMGSIKDYVKTNIEKEMAPTADGKPKEALDWMDSIKAGLQISTTGLAIRGEAPNVVMPEHSTRAMKIASMVGTIAGDLPAMAAGGLLGGILGAPAGAAVGSVVPVVGTMAGIPTGIAVGTGAGAFALPEALRKVMMDQYEKGDIKSSADFWDRVSSTTMETLKAAGLGAATFGMGKLAGVGAKAVGIGARGQAMSQVSSEIATL